MADENNLNVQLISPDGVIWEGEASLAILPAVDGELGIYPDHAPLLAMLGTGEARIHAAGGIRYFALFGGFLEVARNRIQVIVDRVETPAAIDAEAARQVLARLDSDDRRDYDAHDDEMADRVRAETRLRVAARAQGS